MKGSHYKFTLLVLTIAVQLFSFSRAYAQGEQHYVVYHDKNGVVIKRFPYSSPYQIDELKPAFNPGLKLANTGWNTNIDGSGTTYDHTSAPITGAITEDLHLYSVTKEGCFLRYDCTGGSPIHSAFYAPGVSGTAPTPPVRSGYTFDHWEKDGATYSFGPITEQTTIKAVWIPNTNTEYKVNVYLEKGNHDDRATAADAILYATDDYEFGGTITKQGTTGSHPTFTDEDLNSNAVNAIRKHGTPYNLYECDDDASLHIFAKSITDASLNSTTIAGDGSTVVNVYLRQWYHIVDFNFSEFTPSPFVFSNIPIRLTEEFGHAWTRAGESFSSEVVTKMKEQMMKNNYAMDFRMFDDNNTVGYFWGGGSSVWECTMPLYTDYYIDGSYFWPNILSYQAAFSDKQHQDAWIESLSTEGNTFKGTSWLQTLASAKENNNAKFGNTTEAWKSFFIETYDFTSDFEAPEDHKMEYIIDRVSNGYRNDDMDGFEPLFVQIVNRLPGDRENGIPFYAKSDVGPGVHGEPLGGHETIELLPYLNASAIEIYNTSNVKQTFTNLHYAVECVWLRESFELTYLTGYSTFKADNETENVFYEDPLSNHLPKHGGELFVKDVTSFVNDLGETIIFKGWYDNSSCLGTEYNLNASTSIMPAKNFTLYAKWETQTVHLELDPLDGTYADDKKMIEYNAGDTPLVPELPGAPTAREFYCWTLDGAYYDFMEALHSDTKLEALYVDNNKYNIVYNAGKGSGTAPMDIFFYLAYANPQICAPTEEMKAPVDQHFVYWKDQDNVKYYPGSSIQITKNLVLTAEYANLIPLIIVKKGLKPGESSLFTVTKEGESQPIHKVLVTADGTGKAEMTISNLPAGKYTVKEITDWSWAYTPDKTQETKELTEVDHTFTFTNSTKTGTPLHSEADKKNSVVGFEDSEISIKVNDWKKDSSEKKIVFP